MLKKILFLLSALFFCMNIFSGEVAQQNLKWLDYDIPQEIAFKIISYCDLADFGNCKLVCKHFNNFDLDTLICTTHRQAKHECSSIHLLHLSNDYDRCTYILHHLANRINLINSVKFNSQLEENLFIMIYSLHKEKREQLIKETHKNLEQELFSNKIRRRYYRYNASNTYELLHATTKNNKQIRFKQILQSSNQYIKETLTKYDAITYNIFNKENTLKSKKNMLQLLLSTNNNTDTAQQHDLWQKIMLILLYSTYEDKQDLIKFLLSDKFNYLNPYFSADFYTEQNGFLSFCNENDFDLISKRCNNDTSFDLQKIKYPEKICEKESKLSLKIVQWLIDKKFTFKNTDWDTVLITEYRANNIELVKLLIKQNIFYIRFFKEICRINNTEIITWILDNDNNINNKTDKGNHYWIIDAICLTLSVDAVKLLFKKKIDIDFYGNYYGAYEDIDHPLALINVLIDNRCNSMYGLKIKIKNTKEDIEKIEEIIKLFLENGLDLNKKCCNGRTYKNMIEEDNDLKHLVLCSNTTNIAKVSLVKEHPKAREIIFQQVPVKCTKINESEKINDACYTQSLKLVAPHHETFLAAIKSIFNILLNELLKLSKHIRLNLY